MKLKKGIITFLTLGSIFLVGCSSTSTSTNETSEKPTTQTEEQQVTKEEKTTEEETQEDQPEEEQEKTNKTTSVFGNVAEKPVMNGIKTERIGTYAEVLFNGTEINKENLIKFYKENVEGSGYNWVTLNIDGKNGIVFPGASITFSYGELDPTDGAIINEVGNGIVTEDTVEYSALQGNNEDDSKEIVLVPEKIKEIVKPSINSDDELINVKCEKDNIIIEVKLGDPSPLDYNFLAVSRYSTISDKLLEYTGWNDLTVNFVDVGEITMNYSEHKTNENGGKYFETAVFEKQILK